MRNLWHNITHVVLAWEMFREFMARDLNILVRYHQSELVILGKPLVDTGEYLICLINEQVRCNECFNGQKSVHRSLLVCVNGFCGSCHLDESIWNATNAKVICRARHFLWLVFVVIFDDCFKNWNVVSWHGNTWHVVLDVHNQLCFL